MLFKYVKKYWVQYLLGILVLFGVDLLSLYIPQFTGEITDGLGHNTIDSAQIKTYCFYILLAGGGMALGRFGWRFFIFGSARKIEHNMRTDLFDHLSGLSMNFYNENKTGDLMAHFTNDISQIRLAIGPAVISVFDAIVMTVMVIAKMIFYVDLELTLLACIPMLFILLGAVYYIRKAEKLYTEMDAAFSGLSDRVQESISGIRVIKSFVRERQDMKAFVAKNRNLMDKNLRMIKMYTVVFPLLDLTIGISIAITLIYGGWLVTQDNISLGQFVAFSQYIGMLVWPMIACGDSINRFSQGRAAAGRIKKLLDARDDVADSEDASTCNSGEAAKDNIRLEGNITINRLNFRYKEESGFSLSDISVDIRKGMTLAIIGKTGCGKTTVANLLLHLYKTERGMIFFDGIDIRDIPVETLHTQIAYVPQDNFLFSDTVQANIAFGIRDVAGMEQEKLSIKAFTTKNSTLESFLEEKSNRAQRRKDEYFNDLEQVKEAAEKACVHDNIIEFSEGYSTVVGERGVTMSGGQKQRCSIARALIKKSPILILDDALSAVDTDTEERILENLKSERSGRTNIIIAHRISTIQHADLILVMEDGKIVERGSHEELIRLNGRYERLYEKQQLEKMIDKQ